MEIEIYRIIVLKLRVFYPQLQDSLTCYAFTCPILPSGCSLQVFLKVTDVSSREDSGRLCSTEIFSVTNNRSLFYMHFTLSLVLKTVRRALILSVKF